MAALILVALRALTGVIATVSAEIRLGVRFVTLQEPFQGSGSAAWPRKGVHSNRNGPCAPSEALITRRTGSDEDVSLTVAVVIVTAALVAVRAAYSVERGRR